MLANRPTRALIHLDRLVANYREAERLARGRAVMSVVKGDAYGHGAIMISRTLQAAGCQSFGVATLDEAVTLREAGIAGDVFLLGGLFPGEEEEAIRQGITCTVYDDDVASRLQQSAMKIGEKAAVHLKVDTGMTRLGFDLSGFSRFSRSIGDYSALAVRGIFSHPSHADQEDPAVTEEQSALLATVHENLSRTLGEFLQLHIANSAALMGERALGGDLVRPGIMLYGGYPAAHLRARNTLAPVLELSSSIVQIRSVEAGRSVSYGGMWRANRKSLIGVVPAGYADGVSRRLSNVAEFIVGGRRVPLCGRVCMDMLMVDLTDVPDPYVGQHVTLIGRDGAAEVSADEWGDLTGTISYEVLCNVSPRVPRVYVGETELEPKC
jgi:alanine racemase